MNSDILANNKVDNSFKDVRRELAQLKNAVDSMENLLDQIEALAENSENNLLSAAVRAAEHNLNPQFMQNPARSINVFSKQVEDSVYSLMLAALKA
jgi:paraquat-inducible protein B